MGRRLIVNGEVLDVVQDKITASQLKQQLQTEQNTWVVIRNAYGLKHLNDHEAIPTDTQNISIVPAYEYGG
jgi:hypothetical protein